jgi:hypothetical protein
LLSCKKGLLILCAVEEVELGLNGMEPVVGFQWFACFSEVWWMGCQEFHIEASCLISSIANHDANTDGIGHEETQQLGLLLP